LSLDDDNVQWQDTTTTTTQLMTRHAEMIYDDNCQCTTTM